MTRLFTETLATRELPCLILGTILIFLILKQKNVPVTLLRNL